MPNTNITGPVILTHCGHYFDFTNPEGSVIDLEDIAHSLSNICRFTGHCKHHYSVAQHSVLASFCVPQELAFAALMHDAAEAYLGDVAHPLKQLLPDYRKIEQRVERAVFSHFGIPYEHLQAVKEADLVMLATEKRDIMESNDHWVMLDGIEARERPVLKWFPEMAKAAFLQRFKELTGAA